MGKSNLFKRFLKLYGIYSRILLRILYRIFYEVFTFTLYLYSLLFLFHIYTLHFKSSVFFFFVNIRIVGNQFIYR